MHDPFCYSLYIDVIFTDGEQEYSFGIPFEAGSQDCY